MVECAWVMSDGDHCKSWLPVNKEHCQYHEAELLKIAGLHAQIMSYFKNMFGGKR